ncbi:hypothetical protein BSZ35_06265 [Salinibacter sp. 10B]|uniref:DUF4340 domain-containing protein n=1 Tax=Salinibacter sp. 10B TaxID=1923971 RepID=UPI000CF41EC4|nr:DUF4340 domain-containing protein [Salinibacter sp. 10B]PQJ34253.1 hypothetical protein BSZ35_06265 [Salinibacter sp. 10B]
MTNATKTLSIVFVGTLLLALGVSWRGSDTSSEAFQGQLLPVDTSVVQAVRIERANEPSVRLEQGDGGWSVVPSDTSVAFPANEEAVRRLLSSLPGLQVDAVVTRQSSKHPRYGVDSTGTAITMLGSGDETLGQLIVGRTRIRRPQSRNQGRSRMRQMRRRRGTPITYVRSPNRTDVYSIEQSLQSITSRSVEDWRDKVIWNVDRADIQRVDFTFPGDSSFTMRRPSNSDTSSAVGPSTWVAGGDTLASRKATFALRTLSTLEANSFASGVAPNEVGPARHTIRLHLSDGTQRTLQLRPAPSGDAYRATAEGYNYVARLQRDTWDSRVLRQRAAYLDSN